jgi:hypothetical protein
MMTQLPPQPNGEIYAERTVYGQIGPLQVVRLVRSDLNLALTHVVVLGHPRLGPTFVAGFPDTEEGVGLADEVGQAIVRALQIAATPIA